MNFYISRDMCHSSCFNQQGVTSTCWR